MKSLTTTVIGFALAALLAPIGVSAQRGLSVSESSVATNVVDRMPTGVANMFMSSVERVYAWTRIEGADGETMIHHVWIHEGVERADINVRRNWDRVRSALVNHRPIYSERPVLW